MPKTKTSRATAKRIKVTGTGRLRRRQSGAKHLKVAVSYTHLTLPTICSV